MLIFFFLACPLFPQHALQLESHPFSLNEDDDSDDSFSIVIGADSGMLFGMLQEWVFIDREGDYAYDDVLSRLDWQQNPLFYLGVSGSVMPLPRFFIGFGGWLGIPGILGYMEDRDWDDITGAYTTFSHVENHLLNALFLDLNFGYNFIDSKTIVLNGIVGFNFKQIRMSGQDGWQESPPGTFDQYLTGQVIDYEINFFLPYLGFESSFSPLEWFLVDFFLSISPLISFVYARDFHLYPTNIAYFQDFPQFGFSFSGVISLAFNLGAGFSFRVKNNFMWIPPFKGPTYVNGYRATNALAGSSLILGGLSLSLNYGFSR